MAIPLGIELLGSLASTAMQSAPNAVDRARKKRMGVLEAKERGQTFGLDGREKTLAEHAAYDNMRTATGAMQQNLAAATAREGGNAGDLARIRREAMGAVAGAQADAGQKLTALDMQKAAQEREELAALRDAQAQRQRDVGKAWSSTAGKAAELWGTKDGGVPLHEDENLNTGRETMTPLKMLGRALGIGGRKARPVQPPAPTPPPGLPDDAMAQWLADVQKLNGASGGYR